MPGVIASSVIASLFIASCFTAAFPSANRNTSNTNHVIAKRGSTVTPTNSNAYGNNKYPKDLADYVTSSSSSFNPVADDYKLAASGYGSSANQKYSPPPNQSKITSTLAVITNYAAMPSYHSPSVTNRRTTSYPSYGAKFESSHYATNYNTPIFNAWSSPTY